MATTIRLFRMTDREVLTALDELRKAVQADSATVRLHLDIAEHVQPITGHMIEVLANTALSAPLSANAALFHSFVLTLEDKAIVRITRGIEAVDTCGIEFPQNYDPGRAMQLLTACARHLQALDRSDSISKVLGPEMAEFYRRREETVRRLEQLNQDLIEKTSEYRRRLDHEAGERNARLQAEFDVAREKFRSEFDEKEATLKAERVAFEEQKKALDDRRATHARRQIRTDIKSRIEAREKSFSTSEATIKKRRPIHALFIALIATPALILIWALWDVVVHGVRWDGTPNDWIRLLRIPFGAAGIAGFLIYYIRWNDRWFTRHAEEEFKLKQLDLDVDRASWMVEMMLEWKDEKGSPIPPELIDRLSRNLFTTSNATDAPVSHPMQDAMSAILRASTSVTVPLPGGAVATLGTKGLRQLEKTGKDGGDT